MFEIKVPFKTFKTFKKTKPESYNHNIYFFVLNALQKKQ